MSQSRAGFNSLFSTVVDRLWKSPGSVLHIPIVDNILLKSSVMTY